MGAPRGRGVPPGVALCCCLLLLPLCAGRPEPSGCQNIDCILLRRQFCPQGSSECGPCLSNHTEAANGSCIALKKSQHHSPTPPKISPPVHHKESDGPEAVIDFLAEMMKVNAAPASIDLAEQANTTPSNPAVPPNPPASGPSGRNDGPGSPRADKKPPSDALLLGVVVACAIAGLMALLVAGICWCRMRKEMKLAEKTDYPAFRQSPPPPYEKSSSPGDKKLAQNAQMYHYQHQKQQMISMEKNKDDPKHSDSAVTSDEENEDGDFTVYECPGLAPTGEMEVKNPLFDDSTLHHAAHPAHHTH